MNNTNITSNNQETMLMAICRISDDDSVYELLKPMLEKNSNIRFIDNNNNTVFDNLTLDGHKNPKTINLLAQHLIKNIQIQKTENVISFREKYLEFFVKEEIKLPPLKGDLYDWKIEYERITSYDRRNIFYKFIFSNTTQLDFCACEIKELPKEIGEFKFLKSLNLEHNELIKLPDEISKLENLETLYIGSNKFKEIPECIFSLKKLKYFSIRNNEITYIFSKLFDLKNLEQLYFSGIIYRKCS